MHFLIICCFTYSSSTGRAVCYCKLCTFDCLPKELSRDAILFQCTCGFPSCTRCWNCNYPGTSVHFGLPQALPSPTPPLRIHVTHTACATLSAPPHPITTNGDLTCKQSFPAASNGVSVVTNGTVNKLHLLDGPPISSKLHHLCPEKLVAVKVKIAELLKMGGIKPSSTSSYSPPIHLVPKQDGSW